MLADICALIKTVCAVMLVLSVVLSVSCRMFHVATSIPLNARDSPSIGSVSISVYMCISVCLITCR